MHHAVDDKHLEKALDRAGAFLIQAKRVAVLTGAGVSAESGVATFRGAGGLWEGQRVEDVATPYAFERDPTLVWRFYNARRAGLHTVKPNPGHLALLAIEDHLERGAFALITQNIDGLHRLAGSRNVFEIHGSIARTRCCKCGKKEERGSEALPELPACRDCGGLLRPDVVWFYEALPENVWQEASAAAALCECFLVIGTSAIVYPAAGLVETARRSGAKVIEVNVAATPASDLADVSLHGPAGIVLPRLVEKLGRS